LINFDPGKPHKDLRTLVSERKGSNNTTIHVTIIIQTAMEKKRCRIEDSYTTRSVVNQQEEKRDSGLKRERKKERQIQKENKKKETMAAFFVTKARRKKEDATMDANWRRKETVIPSKSVNQEVEK
ncbi:hypothetical protein Tco_0069637, partial [Tanacetum coccineum]